MADKYIIQFEGDYESGCPAMYQWICGVKRDDPKLKNNEIKCPGLGTADCPAILQEG